MKVAAIDRLARETRETQDALAHEASIKQEAADVDEESQGGVDALCSFAEGARGDTDECNACYVCRKLQPAFTSTNQHPRAAPPVLVYSLACEQRYLDTNGLLADNERRTDLGTGRRRSSTNKSASRKNEIQVGAATEPRQRAAYKTAAVAQAPDAISLPQPKLRPASGYYGGSAQKKRWKAHIRCGGKSHYLCTFDTKQEAALAYDREARQRGAKKPLNYESMEGAEDAATKAQAEYALTHGPHSMQGVVRGVDLPPPVVPSHSDMAGGAP
jgi:hypothetical protein